jgi:succinate-semialdehyde dehydrogenase/glutarate-semialdehyde dehydrogenase
MSAFETTNPFTGDLIETYKHMEMDEVELVIQEAHKSFQRWRFHSPEARAKVLLKLAHELRIRSKELAATMTEEMGKPIAQSKTEIEKCAMACEYYADNGVQFLKTETPEAQYKKNEIHFEPQGVILAIMPWNFPVWQLIRFAAPAIMAGNTVVMKHSDITAGTAEMMGEIFKAVSDPVLLFNAPMTHETCADAMAHPKIHGVTFTGSSKAGKQIAQNAARNLKKTVLELGGSDAYIVLKDADINEAASICAQARLINSGQSCIAAKRFIVEESVVEVFLKKFCQEMETAKVGDPSDETVRVGPMASKKFQKTLAAQVEKLKSAGGKIVSGGIVPEGPGAFFPATVIVFEKNVPELAREELFGPVAIVVKASNASDAVHIANSSVYGLGGAIFSKNIEQARQMAKYMECGFVAINDSVRSDPRLPFGGVKDSGYGRELSRYGLLEFCNIKTLGINP